MLIRSVLVTSIVFCAPAVWAQDESPPENQTADQVQLAHEQEVGAAIAELRSKLRELHQAYISRLQALRTAANTAGDQTEAQRATELIEFDPQMLRLEPRRSLWKSRDGFFERLHEGHWIEKIPNGDAKLLSEAGRTAEYVELSGQNTIVRLYDNRCMVRFPSDGKPFAKFYDGAWSTK